MQCLADNDIETAAHMRGAGFTKLLALPVSAGKVVREPCDDLMCERRRTVPWQGHLKTFFQEYKANFKVSADNSDEGMSPRVPPFRWMCGWLTLLFSCGLRQQCGRRGDRAGLRKGTSAGPCQGRGACLCVQSVVYVVWSSERARAPGAARGHEQRANRVRVSGPLSPRAVATGVCVCALVVSRGGARMRGYILQANAVRKLAARIATLRKYGQENILIAVDLKEFLPAACAEYQAVWMNEQGEELKPETTKKGRHLDFGWWLLAWDRYALAAAATQQMDFSTAMKHKAVIAGMCCGLYARGAARHALALSCAGIAANASTEGLCPLVAVLYDELVRLLRVCFLCFPFSCTHARSLFQERMGERV